MAVDLTDEKADEWRAGALALPLPAFAANTNCADVYERFREQTSQIAAAIVDEEDRVVGIVNRLRFLARYAQRFVPELYQKRPILHLANVKPLVVDEAMTVEDLAAMIALDCPDALRECFVVTRQGRYLGIGTSEALVRSKVALLMERQERLNVALAAAEDADRTKSNFLALMSHELRTPLNAIIGFSEVLAGELYGPHSVPRYGEYARDIHGAGKHLLALINDILDLSKCEAGRLELQREDIDVAELFQRCVRLIGGRASERRLKLASVAPRGLTVRADELRLKQILLNLLSNSVKFTEPGGSVEMVASRSKEGAVDICVTDTGISMAPELIPVALEPFRQIDSPLSRQAEGTGLGLSLAKSLTEAHGGTLSITSAPNRGTTVRLSFPPPGGREAEAA
ncbi:MAG: CBS domain-containing protein [Alphaproteobacteria bacterium]|nr:CBS domain-containing protein [Alphaproteobacteria bacterium]